MIDRSRPPISKDNPDFRFPSFVKSMLPNGIKIYFYEDRTQPLESIHFIRPLGASSFSKEGLSYFCAQMLIRSAAGKSAAEISEAADLLGASLKASGNRDDTSLGITFLNKFEDLALKILADCVLKPDFRDEEIERLRKKHIATIMEESAEQSYLAKTAFFASLFREHPYGRPIMGTADSIASIKRVECMDWYARLLDGPAPTIIASGNFDREVLFGKLEKKFGGIKPGGNSGTAPEIPKPLNRNKIAVVDKKDSIQSTIRIGKLSINHDHPHYPALQMANTIFGGYFKSRLNELLREEKGLTYGVGSMIMPGKLLSCMMIGSDVNKESTSESVNDILSEMRRMSDTKVTDEELEIARQHTLGAFVRRIETPQQVSVFLKAIDIFALPENYFDDFFRTLANINAGKLFEAQKDHLRPEGMVIAASGDTDFLEKELEHFGEITRYDTNGNPIE